MKVLYRGTVDLPERADRPQWEVPPGSPGQKLPFAHPLERKAPCAHPTADRNNVHSRAASSADPRRSSKRIVAPASEAQRPAKKNAPAQAAADAEAAPATEAEPVAEAEQAAGVGIVIERYFGPSEPEATSPLLARWLTSPDLPAICLM